MDTQRSREPHYHNSDSDSCAPALTLSPSYLSSSSPINSELDSTQIFEKHDFFRIITRTENSSLCLTPSYNQISSHKKDGCVQYKISRGLHTQKSQTKRTKPSNLKLPMNSQSRKLRDPFVINNITMAAATATLKATKPNSKIFVPHPFNRLMTQCNNSCTNHSTKESVLRLRGGGTEGKMALAVRKTVPQAARHCVKAVGTMFA